MGRLYENPPLVEALCEFRFLTTQEWDLTLPGIFYQEIKRELPRKQEQNAFELQVKPGRSIDMPEIGGTVQPRVQFLSDDETRLVQLGPGMLSVNQLQPYGKWHDFKARILHTVESYYRVAAPSALARIGLRYINRVDIPAERPVSRYFVYRPHLPEDIRQEPKNILLRTEIEHKQSNGILLYTLASTPSEKDHVHSLLYDLDFVTLDAADLGLGGISEWIERAHSHIEAAFEAGISDELRATFKECRS